MSAPQIDALLVPSERQASAAEVGHSLATCAACGASLAGRRRGIVYCSARCRVAGHRARRAGRSQPQAAAARVIRASEPAVTLAGPPVTVAEAPAWPAGEDEHDVALLMAHGAWT
jgi:hypothetical protein